MAKPRIFVSSTYFDLRTVRADIERFIKEMGYEPVLFEKGHIPYGNDEALEDYCYREINTCDILITIIGGKYGSQSRDLQNSITQKELKTAVELGRQIYVFIERSVHYEYRTYIANKENDKFKPVAVNDTKVFKFIEEIYALPSGNPIEPFDISDDITRFLKEQWSGLFQRLLKDNSRKQEIRVVEDLKSTADTLKNIVTFLTEEKSKGSEQAINEILLSNHPAFSAIKQAANIPYRVVFYDLHELRELLEARSFMFDDLLSPDGFIDFDNKKLKKGIRVSKSIFDENQKLKIFSPHQWDAELIGAYKIGGEPPPEEFDDDIPF